MTFDPFAKIIIPHTRRRQVNGMFTTLFGQLLRKAAFARSGTSCDKCDMRHIY
jgi:hypothetical protein